MGSIFSGTSTTSTPLDTSNFVNKTDLANNYVNKTDLANYAKTTDLSNYAKTTDLSNYANKTTDLSNYANKTTDLANYLKYNDDKKSINVNINSDTDYFTLNDLNNKQIAKFGKNTIIDNINSKQVTINNNGLTAGLVLTNQSGGQKNIFSIQNGNDTNTSTIGTTDFLRIGQVALNTDGSIKSQYPFVRMDMNPNDTDGSSLTTRVRSNVSFNKDINIGDDNKYYNISRDNTMCLILKYKDTGVTPNKDIQIGRWCPPSGTV